MMPLYTQWMHEFAIIHSRAEGVVTIEELYEWTELLAEMFSVPGRERVHHFVDLRNMTDFPKNIPEYRKSTAHLVTHPQVGRTVAFGASQNRLLNFFIQVGIIMNKIEIVYTDDPEKAARFLSEDDATLTLQDVRERIARAVEAPSSS